MIALIMLVKFTLPFEAEELGRFPSYEQCGHMLAANQDYDWRLAQQFGVQRHRVEWIKEVHEENKNLRAAWELLRDIRQGYSQGDFGMVGWTLNIDRKEGLKRLRTMIGERRYLEGAMPPPVPYWRYNYVD